MDCPIQLLQEAIKNNICLGSAHQRKIQDILESKNPDKIKKGIENLIHCINFTTGQYLSASHLIWKERAEQFLKQS